MVRSFFFLFFVFFENLERNSPIFLLLLLLFFFFTDVLAAESAVQVLNGSELGKRSIKVGRPHRGQSGPQTPANTLSIGQEAIKK